MNSARDASPDRLEPQSAVREAVLRVDSLSVSYRGGGRHVRAIDNVSFSVGAGEAYGLVGESGSGKSTVAMAIVRYLARNAQIEAGQIELAGQNVGAMSGRALRTLRRRDVSLVYQDPARALNPTLTIGRQLTEAFELAGHRADAARSAASEMLERVRIPSVARALASYPHQLSGGMQQRAVIAMALAKRPSLLILDEPTTGLDATVEAEIMALVDTLRHESGLALLLISHKLPLVAGLCERVGILEHGRLVEEGESARVFAHPEHPYTAALLACLPTIGRTRHDGPLATLDDLRADANRTHPVASAPKVDPSRARDQEEPTGITAAAILEANALTKHYRVGRETVHALEGVSISLRAGQTLGLVGESGSGKTTLARIMAGLVEADAGEVLLDRNALPARIERRSRAQTATLQTVFQNPHGALNRAHRVQTLLGRAVGKLAGLRGNAREQRVRTLLDAVRIPQDRLGSRARELSGGQQQRIAIARAFAGEPRVVICDEPTSALDVSVQATILNLLVDLQRERQVSYVFISHDLSVVRYMADHVAVLYRGQIVESGPADALFAEPKHPYTRTLLSASAADTAAISSASASASASGSASASTPASAPVSAAATTLRDVASHSGCVYAGRCPASLGERCERERPIDIGVRDDHTVRCHLYRDDT